MKKLILCLATCIFILSSCSDNELNNYEFETVLFEGSGVIHSNTQKSARKIHLYNKPLEIRSIKNSDETLIGELNTLENILNFNINSLDIYQSRVFTYLDSRTKALVIPFKNKLNSKELVIYLNSKKSSYCLASFDNSSSGEKMFKLTSLDGKKLFYSMIVNSEDRIRELKVRKIKKPESSITLAGLKTMSATDGETCPESTDGFDDCMVCAITDECAGDWVCSAACMVAPVPCLIGFGVACGFF